MSLEYQILHPNSINNQMAPKQVIVVRKDLHMRMGKIAVQASHASMKVILDMMIGPIYPIPEFPNFCERVLRTEVNDPVNMWVSNSFTKVCVYVTSEDELMKVFNSALQKGIHCTLIEDEGRTEFKGVKTKTCCAIGPDHTYIIDEITGHLPLL